MLTNRPFRFGVVAAQACSGDEWVAKARRAEALGYSTFVVPDTLGPTLAPATALAVLAAATRTIHLGTFVLANDFRNPVHVARECATLDFLSGGRFELGLGAGRPGAGQDNRKLGIPFDSGGVRVDRLAEALGIVKALLGGRRVSASGPYYAIADAEAWPRPIQQPRPPVLVAGGGRRLLSLAAREADIVGLGVRPDADEADLKERIDWLRVAAGDRFPHLELNMNLVAVVGTRRPDPRVSERIRDFFHLDLDQLVQARSPFILRGAPEEMCEQLLGCRERLGISYVTLAEDLMETFAPVVERLAGR